MLQFITERNVLLYVLVFFCTAGVVSQLILRQLYANLIRDTRKPGEPGSRFLQQLRQRFQYCSHLNDRIGNVHALVERSVMEYRFWGLSLHQWKRMGVLCLILALACAAEGTVLQIGSGAEIGADNVYLWSALLSVLVTAAAYGISDTAYAAAGLEVRLVDYLENSGAVRQNPEAAPVPEEVQGKGLSHLLSSRREQERSEEVRDFSGARIRLNGKRRSRRQARAEAAAAVQTRAQKEKMELKENLARVKAGIQETAASSESAKEPSAASELIRQIPPEEQERILREMLREFLSQS